MYKKKETNNKQQPNSLPAFSKSFNEGLLTLLSEVELAITWDRPSILIVVHKSKIGQQKACRELEKRLTTKNRTVIHIKPDDDQPSIFQTILKKTRVDQDVFFVESLGTRPETFSSLNLYRETLVEEKIRILFWLTEQEAKQLPYLAPDFWAFRHRVIEFAAGHGSKKHVLPAGILIWQAENDSLFTAPVDERIAYQEELLLALPTADEAMMSHGDAVYLLANLYWIKGETQKTDELLNRELLSVRRYGVFEMESRLLNGLAILFYEQGKYEEAYSSMEEATIKNPRNEILWANLGVVNHALGRAGHAVRNVAKAIKINPRSSKLWDVQGYIQVSMGKLENALSSFENALRLDKDDDSAYYALGFCYAQMGRFDLLQKLTDSPPDNAKSREIYHSICKAGISGNAAGASEKLLRALRDGQISERLLQRDPGLNMIFDTKTIESQA